MVMTFTLTPLSHYNFITKPRARFLLSLLEDLSIDFPSHLITSIIDVYQDTATCDKLIFLSAIMRILWHFSIPIPLSPLFTTMGAINIGSIRRSKVQLQMKQPRVESTNPASSAVPPSFSASSTSETGGVTLKTIIAQLQWIEADFGGCLDYLTDEICQMNTRIGCITRRQSRIGGFRPSPSPSLEASANEGDNADDDKDDASSSDDDEVTTSQ